MNKKLISIVTPCLNEENNIAKVYEKVTGKPCGCSKRKDSLNRNFPYNK